MIRGIYIGRFMVSGAITMTAFAARAISKVASHPILDLLIEPVVVFIMFLAAAMIVFYPSLKGRKALILAPLIVIAIAFFVYAYYVLP